MPTHFTIPTWFTAVDKMTPSVAAMGNSLDKFAAKADVGVTRAERAFKRMTPALGEASKQMLSMVGTAAVVGGIFAGGAFSVKSIMDYETELANLQALAGEDADMNKFKESIKGVATETKMSAVEVTKAFTAIANNQPELVKNSEALGAVTKSSIILAQAAKMELQPAGEALTQIMNQFSLGAKEAGRTIDVLAAGSVAGSSEIQDTADAIQKFGTVAANAGIKIDESVALIELSSKFEKGAEAGSKLRNILITMSTAKVQDPKALQDMHRLGVNMDIVSNKSLPLSVRLKEMGKVSKDDAALFHIFGKENQALATGVLANAASFDQYQQAVNKAGQAQKMADVNNATLGRSLEQLRDKFVTWLVTSDEAHAALELFRKGAVFLADNLSTILKVTGLVVGAFVAWKAWLVASRIAVMAMRAVSSAFFLVDMIKYVAATNGISFAQAAWQVVTTSVTDAQLALNAAMFANPIGLVIIAVAALAAGIMYLQHMYDSLINSMHQAAVNGEESAKKQMKAERDRLIQEKGMTEEAAQAQALASEKRIAMKVYEQAKLREAAAKQNTGVFGMSNLDEALKAHNETIAAQAAVVALNKKDVWNAPGEAVDLNKQIIDPKANAQKNLNNTVTNNVNKNLTIDFKNMPKGVEVAGDAGADVVPKSSSTMNP